MGLLRRFATIAPAVALLIALTSLPTLRTTTRTTGSALAPAVAWAGGSPDETLHPQQTPSSTPSAIGLQRVRTERDRFIATRPARLTFFERLLLVYRVTLASERNI